MAKEKKPHDAGGLTAPSGQIVEDPTPKAVAPPKRKITDVELAEALADFRDNRTKADQEASPVFQELVQFVQWGMATYNPTRTPQPPPTTEAPPDPRLSNVQKQQIMQKQNQGKPPVLQNTQVNANVIQTQQSKPNPWANSSNPPPSGPCAVEMPNYLSHRPDPRLRILRISPPAARPSRTLRLLVTTPPPTPKERPIVVFVKEGTSTPPPTAPNLMTLTPRRATGAVEPNISLITTTH